MFYPTWVDVLTFAGTFGVFFLMYLLFIRFLPVIAISEVRAVLPEANPHTPPIFLAHDAPEPQSAVDQHPAEAPPHA